MKGLYVLKEKRIYKRELPLWGSLLAAVLLQNTQRRVVGRGGTEHLHVVTGAHVQVVAGVVFGDVGDL